MLHVNLWKKLLFVYQTFFICVCMGTYDVKTAASVPTGMLFSGRWRSELMLKPAITPTHTHTPNMYTSDCLNLTLNCRDGQGHL